MEALLKLALEKGLLALALALAFIIYRERTFYLEKKEWDLDRDKALVLLTKVLVMVESIFNKGWK